MFTGCSIKIILQCYCDVRQPSFGGSRSSRAHYIYQGELRKQLTCYFSSCPNDYGHVKTAQVVESEKVMITEGDSTSGR